jgi:NAD-dependent deacetylase
VERNGEAVSRLKDCSALLVLTGAGVSAESGIPTFRGTDGLWRTHRAEDLATPQAFDHNPRLVWEWYEYRRRIIESAEPNAAHEAIARLEASVDDFLLVTQNVDGLHARAGSEKIVELHGNIFRNKCSIEDRVVEKIVSDDQIPLCDCGAYLRPDVVWFGESLPNRVLEEAFTFAARCDLMMVVGTSGLVHPAASLPSTAKSHGAWVLEVNLEPTPITRFADHSIFGKAGEVLPRMVEMLKA